MEMMLFLVALAPGLVLLLARKLRGQGDRHAIGRALNRSVAAQARQVALWERYLATQRPWQREPTPLRWSRTARGWRLVGTVLPEVRPQCRWRRVQR